MNKRLACLLSHASSLAYAIPQIGQDFESYPALDQDLQITGLSRDGCKFFRPAAMGNINACYYGVNSQNEPILAFRGTQPPTLIFRDPEKFFEVVVNDWLNDANATLVNGVGLPGKVHRGFLESLDSLWPDLLRYLKASHDMTKPLYVTGHSKGGGLAFLTAYRLLNAGLDPAGVYTFAAPRVGDAGFAALFDDKLKAKTWRLEYRDDLVPHLPPHTAAWTVFLKGFNLTNFKIPFEIPQLDPGVKQLIDRIEILKEEGFANYTSAGTLMFINWNTPPTGELESPALTRKREIHLAEKLFTGQIGEIISDHFLERGYIPFACS